MTAAPTAPQPGSGWHMVRGSAWMVAQRWSLRLSGIASTALLARLLQPADFGVVAIAMLFVGLVEAVGDTGERLAILRHPAPQREHYDTAFTLQVMVGLVVFAAILLLAPLAEFYFHEPRAVAVIRLLSLRALLGGVENIATIDFRRELKFHLLYRLSLRSKIASMGVALVLALVWRDYWALAWGIVAGQAATTLLSYTMRPFQPRLSLKRRAEIVGFSAWTLLRSLGLYFTSQVDQIILGGVVAAGAMGRYAVASNVAASPIAEINEPVMAVLYPVMSRLSRDRAAMRALFLRVLAWCALISAAAAAGVAAIASDYIALVLGTAWRDAAPLVPWLALAAGLLGISSGVDATFDILGLPHRSARLHWLRFAIFVAGIAPAAYFFRTVEAVAVARLAMSALFLPLLLGAIGRAAGISAAQFAAVIWRPVLAAGLMWLVLAQVTPFIFGPAAARLLIEVPLGAVCYAGALLLLWQAAGRPPSPEQDLVSFLRSLRAPAPERA